MLELDERHRDHFRRYYIAQGGKLMMHHPPEESAGAIRFEGLDGVMRVGVNPRDASCGTGASGIEVRERGHAPDFLSS